MFKLLTCWVLLHAHSYCLLVGDIFPFFDNRLPHWCSLRAVATCARAISFRQRSRLRGKTQFCGTTAQKWRSPSRISPVLGPCLNEPVRLIPTTGSFAVMALSSTACCFISRCSFTNCESLLAMPSCRMTWDNWSAMEHKLGNADQAKMLLEKSFRLRFNAKGAFTILANNINDRTE